MQDLDDSETRQRWIFRLLLVLAVIVGIAAYRKEASSDSESGAGSNSTAHATKRPFSTPEAATAPSTKPSRTARIPELPPIVTGDLRLEGLVVDKDDQPLGGVRVTLGGRRDATTEADGSFAFDGLAEGDYDLAAEQGDWFAEVQATSLSDSSDPVTIKLERGPTLLVRVTDPDAHPLAGAKVSIISRERLTGPDGTVRFRAVELDDELVTVALAGHANVRERVTTSDDPKTTIEKTIVLASGADITGTVVDRNGARVIEAYVDFEPTGGGRSESVWTDDKGVFRLPDLGKGSYVAKASSKDAIAAAPLIVTHDGVHATSGIVLAVEPGGEIAGLVVDSAGHPVPEARVSGGGVGETTDKDGRFVAKGLVPDKYELSASTSTLGGANYIVELARGEHTEVRIVLTPSSLAGIVVDARGEPVEGAAVFARSENPDGYGYSRTDEYGHFDLGGLPPSKHYKIAAQREDSSVDGPSLEVATGNRQVRLVVHDQALLTGRVLRDGKPVPYFGFAITDDVNDSYSRPTPVRDEDGRFTHKDVAPGKVVVVLVGPDFARKVIDNVQIVAGQTTDLGDITVSHGETIHGRVVDDRGTGVAGATVTLTGSGSSYSTTGLHRIMQGELFATSDASGNYELFGVPPSTEERTLKAAHPTRGASSFVTLAERQSAIDIVLHATGGATGTVPATGYLFAAATQPEESRARYYADVDTLGRFTFPALPPGEYEIDMIGRHRLPTAKVIVTPGATATIELAPAPLPD